VAQKARNFLISGLLFAALPMVAYADPVVTVFSSGYTTPETITPVPDGFGTVGGTLLVPDKTGNALYVMSTSGGAPTLFASGVGGNGGAFLPSSFGALGGDFLATAQISGPSVIAVSGTGVQTVVPIPSSDFVTGGAVVAPAGFGSVAGDALMGAENGAGFDNGAVLALSPDGTVSQFASLGTGGVAGYVLPFGIGYAPTGFGSIGGDLLVTDGVSGTIYAVDSSGNVSVFANLSVPTIGGGQFAGLRQFAFAPAGFGNYGGDLFVSVSGSQFGGGTSGSVDVLNSAGALVAVLLQGAVGSPFDPRGLYFNSDNQLLIADTDPSILSAPPGAFTAATPEPSSMLPLGLGLAGIVAASRRARKGCST
jgi:PEP-CTERM motif-containing protein